VAAVVRVFDWRRLIVFTEPDSTTRRQKGCASQMANDEESIQKRMRGWDLATHVQRQGRGGASVIEDDLVTCQSSPKLSAHFCSHGIDRAELPESLPQCDQPGRFSALAGCVNNMRMVTEPKALAAVATAVNAGATPPGETDKLSFRISESAAVKVLGLSW